MGGAGLYYSLCSTGNWKTVHEEETFGLSGALHILMSFFAVGPTSGSVLHCSIALCST